MFASSPCSNLFNKAELAMQLVGCPPQLNEAELLLHLYAAVGLDMLGRLQGQYAFCLYDSKQVGMPACRPLRSAAPPSVDNLLAPCLM